MDQQNPARWTMRRAILFLCIGSVGAAVLLHTALMQVSLRRQIRQESIADNESALERMQSDISAFLHDISSQMLTIYSDTDLIEALREHARAPENWNLKPFYWRTWYLGRKRFRTSDLLMAMYLYDTQDRLISTYRYNCQTLPKDLYDAGYDVNAEKVRQYIRSDEGRLLISGYRNTVENKDIIRFVLRLHNYDEERLPLGYLVCDVDSLVLTRIMEKYVPSQSVFLWLQPVGDRSIASIGRSDENTRRVFRQVSKLAENYYEYMNLAQEYGGDYLVHVNQESYNLEAFAMVPQSIMTAAQRTQNRTLLILAIGMVAVSSVLVTLLSRWISRPMVQMQETIERIRAGETHLRIKPDGWAAEVAVLGNEFNEMLDRMQEMMTEEYEYKLLVERTEYKMLQAQINPHFLYNTLNTMSAIANAQHCELVSGLCQSLSAIFRYCLDMSDELSTVQKEIAHTRNYLYVMDVRNGGQIEYEYQIDSETLSDEIPRITLQPIVENAMTHGLRNSRRKDKRLVIRTEHTSSGELVITVCDNGIGMDAETMNQELAADDLSRVQSGVSIGILNVHARLRKVFGKGYGIEVASTPGEGTTVWIRIPRRSQEK